jgi:hypothetical protein
LIDAWSSAHPLVRRMIARQLRSKGTALGGGRISELLRPGLHVTPVQHGGEDHEHGDDKDGDEERIGGHAVDLHYEESMPAGLNDGFDLHQMRRNLR